MSIHSQNQNHKILKNKFEFGPLDSQKLERQPTETDTMRLERGFYVYFTIFCNNVNKDSCALIS